MIIFDMHNHLSRECVFTHGHWINNRSLFPSQDVPVAMATWQAVIHVPEGLVVLMSGDKDPVVQSYTHRTGTIKIEKNRRVENIDVIIQTFEQYGFTIK